MPRLVVVLTAVGGISRRAGLMPVLFQQISLLEDSDQDSDQQEPEPEAHKTVLIGNLLRILINISQNLKDPAYDMLLNDSLPLLAQLLMRRGVWLTAPGSLTLW